MKRTIQLAAIVIATVVIIYSCNSDNTVSPTNNPTATTSLSGQLTNYTFTSQAYLCLVVYDSLHAKHVVDSTLIGSGGSFTLNLTAPASGWLVNPTTDTNCTPRLTYPSGTLIAVGSFEVHDNSGNVRGEVVRSNNDTLQGYHTGQFIGAYTYTNTAYSYSGTAICTDNHDTLNVNVNGAIGWNETVILYLDVYSGMLTKTSESNTEPSGAFWYYIGLADSKQPVHGIGRRNSGNLR